MSNKNPMDRRNFLRGVTAATTVAASGATAIGAPKETRSLSYRIKGFTCITCAVGLEVMLKGLNGVTRASASYPGNTVSIGFDEHVTTEKTIQDFIAVCGFSVDTKSLGDAPKTGGHNHS
ncbi:MAG: twin-arginine translocation signal domain-containing protein [Bryobacteraceae bacterium]